MSDTVTKLWAHPQRDQILQFAGFLADPITRRTMAKLTIHGSMSVNDIDTKSLRATRAEVVTRLVKIERNGLATSKKISKDGTFHKRYTITRFGRKLVFMYMNQESSEFE